MIKRLTQWNPREGVDREAALRYWRDEHVRVVARVPGVRGYLQNLCTTAPDGADPPYAGLGEVWFDCIQAAQEAAASPQWRAVIDDAQSFMDLERAVVAWAEENVGLRPTAWD